MVVKTAETKKLLEHLASKIDKNGRGFFVATEPLMSGNESYSVVYPDLDTGIYPNFMEYTAVMAADLSNSFNTLTISGIIEVENQAVGSAKLWFDIYNQGQKIVTSTYDAHFLDIKNEVENVDNILNSATHCENWTGKAQDFVSYVRQDTRADQNAYTIFSNLMSDLNIKFEGVSSILYSCEELTGHVDINLLKKVLAPRGDRLVKF